MTNKKVNNNNLKMIERIEKILNEDSKVEAYRIKYGNETRSKGSVPKFECDQDYDHDN
jgi:hypothetical protein